jgi:glycosyltransferase involved in cell wall biosynthesis
MRIALVGGIYGKDQTVRRIVQCTPETILERELIARGHDVTAFSHYASIETTQFDLVHVHHLGYGAASMAVDSSESCFIYTSHDGVAMAGSPNPRLRQIAARFVMARADAVVALSKSEADFQRRTYQLDDALHTVIPNGIDAANYFYARNNRAGKGRPWLLLYVGQLITLKNVHVLLHALLQVRQPVELELVYHNATLEIPLRRLAVELGLKERVRFLGPKTPGELASAYQRADVFVLPSASEVLPSVVTEAIFCGTPVIASDVGGVREQLGGYGACVSPGRPNELAATIMEVLDNYGQFASRGETASAYARRQFSIESMVDRHLELYADALGKLGQRRRRAPRHIPAHAILRMGVKLICATK